MPGMASRRLLVNEEYAEACHAHGALDVVGSAYAKKYEVYSASESFAATTETERQHEGKRERG
jgi:hypothetical protein